MSDQVSIGLQRQIDGLAQRYYDFASQEYLVSNRVAVSMVATDTSGYVNVIPNWASAGHWVVFLNGASTEVRKITSISGKQLSWTGALANGHSAGNAVLFLDSPVLYATWFGMSTSASAANNRTYLANTIAEAYALGSGVVMIPAGSYNIDTTAGAIDVLSEVTIKGERSRGAFRGTMLFHTGGTTLFSLPNDFYTARIEDITFRTGASGSVAIDVQQPKTYLTGLTFLYYAGTCISIGWPGSGSGGWGTHIERLDVIGWDGDSSETEIGVLCERDANAVSIDKFYITGCSIAGIKVEGANGLKISNGNVSECRGGSAEGGIVLGGSYDIKAVTIDSVYLEDNDSYGIYAEKCIGLAIRGIYQNGLTRTTHGIYLTSSSVTDVTVQNSVIVNCTNDMTINTGVDGVTVIDSPITVSNPTAVDFIQIDANLFSKGRIVTATQSGTVPDGAGNAVTLFTATAGQVYDVIVAQYDDITNRVAAAKVFFLAATAGSYGVKHYITGTAWQITLDNTTGAVKIENTSGSTRAYRAIWTRLR